MLEYNTNLKQMILPEYGRNVHEMVEYCINIPDREERTHCARSIAKIMANMFPELVEPDGSNHKIWDHIMIMSNFNLDIDFPCEVIRKEAMNPKPQRLSYGNPRIKLRCYGKNLEKMALIAAGKQDSEEKDAMIRLIANHMKLMLATTSPESVDDSRVLRDLCELTGGKININPDDYKLEDVEVNTNVHQNWKKKKKKKN